VPDAVVRIDPATNAVTGTFPVGHTVSGLAYGLGALWITSTRDGLLIAVDPASGEVTTAALDLVDPLRLAIGGDRVWVGLQGVGTDDEPDPSVPDLFRWDPATGSSGAFDYDLRPEAIGDIAVTDDAVWLQAIGPFLMRLDPDSAAVESTISADLGTGALVVSDEALWLTVWRENAVFRIDF